MQQDRSSTSELPLPRAWEWGTLIAVALDRRAPARRADRAVVAVVAVLAATAAVLSAFLV